MRKLLLVIIFIGLAALAIAAVVSVTKKEERPTAQPVRQEEQAAPAPQPAATGKEGAEQMLSDTLEEAISDIESLE